MIMTTTNSKSPITALTATNEITPLFAKDYNVYINHTDAGGIVYHANHLVFFENCRRDWFSHLGLNGYFLQTDKGDVQHFVVSQADLQYKRAILLDEVISVRVDKIELKPASIIFHQSIHRHIADSTTSHNINASSSLLSSAKIVIACVQNQVRSNTIGNDTASMRPIRVPQKLRTAIEQAINEQMNAQ